MNVLHKMALVQATPNHTVSREGGVWQASIDTPGWPQTVTCRGSTEGLAITRRDRILHALEVLARIEADTNENDLTKLPFTVLEVCNAYESGFGHGLQERDLPNPYVEGSNGWHAYAYGYQEGAERASEDTGPASSPVPTSPPLSREQIALAVLPAAWSAQPDGKFPDDAARDAAGIAFLLADAFILYRDRK